MKSVVEIEINASQEKVAELHADPHNNPKWMHDIARCELVSGDVGMPDSTYRLVPKEGDMIFLATVVERNLPKELKLHLETEGVMVEVKARFIAVSPEKTKLISEQVFTFKGQDTLPSLAIENAIKAAHRGHIGGFKQFAEKF
jgi:hypothetical protein